jgi:hypothetical protein
LDHSLEAAKEIQYFLTVPGYVSCAAVRRLTDSQCCIQLFTKPSKNKKMNDLKHHLVLGELKDFLTGKIIEDNHDERLRQKIVRFLVEEKNYKKENIASHCKLEINAGEKKAIVKVDFKIRILEKTCMIVKYGPGSVVTRQRPSLAASRLIEPYQIPFVIVTNGIDAEILDGVSGKIIGESLHSIPSRSDTVDQFDRFEFKPISPKRIELESRILYAYEVDDSCPCDDNICRL